MPDCIALNCINCGAMLEVPGDIDRFACAYCGTQLQVRRRGGTVALQAIEEAIERVQAGTDKAAAELAIMRLEKERERLLEAEKRSGSASVFIGMMIAGLFGFPGLYLLTRIGMLSQIFGLILLAGAIAGFFFGCRFCRDRTIRDRITETERSIAEQRQIASF